MMRKQSYMKKFKVILIMPRCLENIDDVPILVPVFQRDSV